MPKFSITDTPLAHELSEIERIERDLDHKFVVYKQVGLLTVQILNNIEIQYPGSTNFGQTQLSNYHGSPELRVSRSGATSYCLDPGCTSYKALLRPRFWYFVMWSDTLPAPILDKLDKLTKLLNTTVRTVKDLNNTKIKLERQARAETLAADAPYISGNKAKVPLSVPTADGKTRPNPCILNDSTDACLGDPNTLPFTSIMRKQFNDIQAHLGTIKVDKLDTAYYAKRNGFTNFIIDNSHGSSVPPTVTWIRTQTSTQGSANNIITPMETIRASDYNTLKRSQFK